MSLSKQLPIFPLTSQVLPEGRMKLRIFEPRYIRLVKDSLQNDAEFVIAMFDNDKSPSEEDYIRPYGTSVKIIDFEPRDDGLLGITVEGQSRVRILGHWLEHDNLRVGNIEHLPAWPQAALPDSCLNLKEKLQEAYETYPELSELLPSLHYERLDWLCSRWLEILPLDTDTKQTLIKEENCLKTQEYLLDLMGK